MATFPLQRLPWLAFRKVIHNFCALNFINLIQCSKKFTKKLKLTDIDPDRLIVSLKLGWDSGKLCIGSLFKIEMAPPTLMSFDSVDMWTLKNTSIPYGCSCVRSCCILYTDDETQLAQDLWFFVLEFLDVDFGRVTFDTIEVSRVEAVINHIARKRSSTKSLEIDMEGVDVNGILRKVNVTKELTIKTKLARDFKLKLMHHPKILKISNSSWLTLDDLLTLDCVRIQLYKSLLSIQDISLYVDQWRRGKFPKLRSLVVQGWNLTDEEPISGVPPPIRARYLDPNEDEDEDEYRKRLRTDTAWVCNERISISGGVEIQRDDGVKAVIQMDMDYGYGTWNMDMEHGTFCLLVLEEHFPQKRSKRGSDSIPASKRYK